MKKYFLFCILFLVAAASYAQPGVLDPSFGRKGIAKSDIGSQFNYSSASSQVLTGPDGKTYIVITTAAAGTVVSRRSSSGYIDSTYGIDGYSRNVFFATVTAAFQPDGKIVLAGSGGRPSPGIVRLTTAGRIDLSYGTNGVQDINFTPQAIAIQPDGKSVVAGIYNPEEGFVVARYNSDGSADNDFNGGVPVVTFFPDAGGGPASPNQTGSAYAVALQADGKIVVAGDCLIDEFSGFKFAVARYNADGNIDNSFNGNGRQIISFDPPGENANAKAYSVAIQKDLKIVLSGYVSRTDGPGNDFAIARLNADGSTDDTFDADGKQTTAVGCDVALSNSLALQADSKIVVGGYIPVGDGTNDFLVARYNTDGSPDNSFNGTGIVQTDLETSDDYAGSVVVLNNGKIVIAGYSYVGSGSLFSLAKYNTDGSPDNTFDSDGKLLDRNCHCNTQFFASVVQPDGKLVAAGRAWNGTNFDYAIARFKTDGTPDSTFSNDGKQTANFNNDDEIRSIILQPNGKIIVAGNINFSQSINITRYNADGTRDQSFGTGGSITTAFGLFDVCGNVSLQADGKILVSGYTIPDLMTGTPAYLLARYNSNGTPDNTFGDNGKLFTGFGDQNAGVGRSAAVQSDGKIVIAGRSNIGGQDNIAIARFNADGTPDNSFSDDGKQNSTFGPDNYFAESIVIQPDGRIVVGGYSQDNSGLHSAFIVARYLPNGEPDGSFGSNGFVSVDMGSANFNFGVSVTLLPGGKIAVGGTNDNFAIAVFNVNGTPDYFYNGTGTSSTEVGLAGSKIESIVFGGGYLYATGHGAFPQNSGVVARYLLTDFGPLPVTLIDFKGALRNKKIMLEWLTENEIDLAAFEVQRSATGSNFKAIALVNSKGNSTQQLNYSLLDEVPLSGVNLYRLKLIDKDGRFTYSRTVAVNNKGEVFTVKVFPNPTANTLYINTGIETGKTTISIHNIAGVKVMEKTITVNGEAATPVSVAALPAGTYNLQLISAAGQQTVRFVKR